MAKHAVTYCCLISGLVVLCGLAVSLFHRKRKPGNTKPSHPATSNNASHTSNSAHVMPVHQQSTSSSAPVSAQQSSLDMDTLDPLPFAEGPPTGCWIRRLTSRSSLPSLFSTRDPRISSTEPLSDPWAGSIKSTLSSLVGNELNSIWGRTYSRLESSENSPEPDYPNLKYDIQLMDINLARLGAGASGCVKEALYVSPDEKVFHVAAKYARDSTADSAKIFRSELEIVAKLPHHPNIVHYYGGNIENDAGDGNGNCCIVMELMSTTLHRVIHDGIFTDGLSYRLILKISFDIIKGLNHLHEYGVIHYDLKPSNILLDEDLNAKLADFGCSKRKFRSVLTGSLRGTMGYIAPEVMFCHWCRNPKVSEKLDIFSLGILMWEMVTGEYPPNPHSRHSISSVQDYWPDGMTTMNLVPSVLTHHSFLHASPNRCPPSLRILIKECLELQPDHRPTTQQVGNRLIQMQNSLRRQEASISRDL